MTSDRWLRLRALFDAAAGLDADARALLLDRDCAGDPELRREVESLLANHEPTRADNVDDADDADDTDSLRAVIAAAARGVVETSPPPGPSPVGRRVGRIEVRERLGRGGMGEVYLGFDHTLRRTVVLKAIRDRHRLSATARERFRREARMLSRLDHPHICRIYDFVESDLGDFLVLEHIDGSDLAAAGPTAPARQKEIAIQIAEVLATAHGEGIVHRDLKPQNVMVTAAGEVKVLDFGLARIAASASDDGADELDRTAGAGGARELETDGSQVLGTPIYMSPEQARGETVTTASDMYSFGLLLQWLFTGAAPYPQGLDAAAVLAHAQRAESEPVRGIAPDLATLIEQLKAPAPAARPTAVAALERLRWIRDKPRRRLRRGLAAAAVALLVAAGVKYTVDLGRARDEADRRRHQAEELIGFMLGDLRHKLEPVGRLDVLDEVGDQALAYFATLRPEELTAEELFRRSKALGQIGEVRLAQGDFDDALASLEEARRLAADLVTRDPHNSAWQAGLGAIHFWIGNVHWQRGDAPAALAPWQAYLAVSGRLARLEPENLDWQLELAYAHTNLGAAYEARGELERALEEIRRSNDIKRRLLVAEPASAARAGSLANGLSWLGSTLLSAGQVTASRAAHDGAFEIRHRLAAAEPHDTDAAFLLAISQGLVADRALMAGEVAAALAHHDAAQTRLQWLVGHDPANLEWRRELAVSHRRRGEARQVAGHTEAAGADLRAAHRLLDQLTAADPANADWRREQIAARQGEAARLLASGRVDDAIEVARQALAAFAAIETLDRRARQVGSRAHLVLGSALARRGKPAEAARSWNRALALLAPLGGEVRHPRVLDPRARALLHLGRHDQAELIVRALAAAGYHRPDFLALCEENGLSPR